MRVRFDCGSQGQPVQQCVQAEANRDSHPAHLMCVSVMMVKVRVPTIVVVIVVMCGFNRLSLIDQLRGLGVVIFHNHIVLVEVKGAQ